MDQVGEIREKIDIVSFISEFVTLNKAGRNFKANCPFHTEKTASFVISPERQIWHCFGTCNKGGDVYQFLMEYEKMDFPEALRTLAKRAGVELKERNQGSSGDTYKKEKLYEINILAKQYYHYVLTKHDAGKKALDYLKKRGINEKLIEAFMLGFAPSSGSALTSYLINKKKYSKQDMLDAGLGYSRGSSVSDFFRGRLIFPLVDHRDNIVGFSGRILDNDIKTSKYINTRETLIYHKGDHIFGINNTKDAIRRTNQVIILEGEFDVMTCFENGISNVIAVKGTALTDSQVNLLGRYAEKVTFCFDTDKAGQEAVKRSLSVVEKKGLMPTVIEVPGGKDADEALRSDPGAFKKAVKNDISIYDYLLEKTISSVDVKIAVGKKKVADTLLPFIAQIRNEIIREHYLKKISTELDTSYESIVREMERVEKKEKTTATTEILKLKRPKEEITEEYLLALIVQNSKDASFFQKARDVFSGNLNKNRAVGKIMDKLSSFFGKEKIFDSKKFANTLPQELLTTFDKSILYPLPVFTDAEKIIKEVEKIAKLLRTFYIQEKMRYIAEEIKKEEAALSVADAKGTGGSRVSKEIESLQKEYSALAAELRGS